MTVAYAPFRARNQPTGGRDDWVAVAPEDATTRSTRWVNARPDVTIAAWANTPRTLLRPDPRRRRQKRAAVFCRRPRSAAGTRRREIAELREDQWLVMHNDDRHRPDVRTVIDRIVKLALAHAPLFAGERPIGTYRQ